MHEEDIQLAKEEIKKATLSTPYGAALPLPWGLLRGAVAALEEARRDCAEAYQVVGAMRGEMFPVDHPDVNRVLDNLSAAANGEARPHDNLLPFPAVVTPGPVRFAGEALAQWMIKQGFSTGHGETFAELLVELEKEIEELRARGFKEAVIDGLIVNHIYQKEHETEPRKAVHDLIAWECKVALDPRVSVEARKLQDEARAGTTKVKESGPWKVHRWQNGYALASDDFTHDAALTLSGDWGTDEERRAHAQFLCDKLNASGGEDDLRRSFSILALYGVPRERAGYVSQGIEVLATRFQEKVRILTHELNCLADAIRNAAVKAGICRSDASPNGPELMMLAADMGEIIATVNALANGPEFQDGHDWEGFPGGCKRLGCPDGCKPPRTPIADAVTYQDDEHRILGVIWEKK